MMASPNFASLSALIQQSHEVCIISIPILQVSELRAETHWLKLPAGK